MKKIIGYLIMLAGLIVLLLPVLAKSITDKLPFPSFWIMILGLGIMALGFIFLKPSSSMKTKQIEAEVPIYHKDKIVGYRRAHK